MQKPHLLPPNFHSQEYGGVEPPHDILLAPARSMLPLLRAPLGYRMVHPMRMLPVTLFMVFVPLFTWPLYAAFIAGTGRHVPSNIGHMYLVYFALASFAASLITFARRWHGQRSGEQLHTLEAGYSWLVWYTPLPVWLCEMFIVPVTVGTVGWFTVDTFSVDLGWWLMLSGASLFGLAFWEHRRVWSQHRSAIDETKRAEAFEGRFTRQQQSQSSDEPAIAELGEALRAPPVRTAKRAANSDEQRRDVGASGRSRNAAAQDADDAFF